MQFFGKLRRWQRGMCKSLERGCTKNYERLTTIGALDWFGTNSAKSFTSLLSNVGTTRFHSSKNHQALDSSLTAVQMLATMRKVYWLCDFWMNPAADFYRHLPSPVILSERWSLCYFGDIKASKLWRKSDHYDCWWCSNQPGGKT